MKPNADRGRVGQAGARPRSSLLPASGRRQRSAPLLNRCDTHAVPTDIYFAAENVRVKVDEDPSQVAEAFTSAEGLPFRLTTQGRQDGVYVNPATVAFWAASEPELQPEREELPPPPTKREAVTDIWGNPLRRRPRR